MAKVLDMMGGIETLIGKNDIVIVATGASSPTVKAEYLKSGKKQLIIDLSIPRNVDPELSNQEDKEIIEAVDELAQELQDLQMIMVELRLTGQGQDGVRFGAQLLQKLGYLTRNVSVVDFPPTDQDLEVQRILRDRLAEHLSTIDELVTNDVAALNALLRSKGIGIIGDQE